MFANLDIKLGAEKKSFKVEDTFDALESYAEVVAATENLERTALQLEMLNKTADNMERGQSLAASVADKTGDNEAAIVVGRESLRMSLSMIGQGHLADEAYAGAESVTAGAEGAKDFFKAVWDKIKEGALKVWKWIKDLIAKVVRFVMGVFGKAEDTAEKLTEMLKKLKTDGKTKLIETEFPKDVQLRLAKEIPLLAANNKTLTSAEIEASIESSKIVTNEKKITEAEQYTTATELNSAINKVKDGNIATFVTLGSDENADKTESLVEAEVYTAVNTEIDRIIGDTDVKPTLDNGGTKGVDVQDAIDGQASDIVRGKAILISSTPTNIKVVVVGLTEDANDTYKNFVAKKDIDGDTIGKDTGKYTRTLNAVVNGIKVINVTVKIENMSDATDNADGITPLDFSECTSITKALKDVGKDLEKGLKTLDKSIIKGEKDAEKIYKTVSDTIDKIEKAAGSVEAKKVGKAVNNAYQKLLKINLEVAKGISVGAAETSKEIVRSKFSHIVNESAKLFINK